MTILSNKMHHEETELISPVNLCDEKGHLNPSSVGWSRYPIYTCNIKGNFLRKKKWNYWLIINDQCLFCAAIANTDYIGLIFTYFFEFKTNRFIEKNVIIPFAKGCYLPETVDGNISIKHKAINFSFINENRFTKIFVESKKFGDTTLSANLLVEHPEGYETLNVVIPWSIKRFHFTSKQNCLPVKGAVSVGNQSFSFHPENAFANLDFGRGIWKYFSFWNWASCSGSQNRRTIGLNLGAKWTDRTGMTENGILVDGKINKLSEDISFTYDKSDFMKPWTIRTKSSKRIDIQFIPFYDRVSKTNLLLLSSEIHQLFGKFSGNIVTDNGETIRIENIIGIAEEHIARW